MTRVQLIPPVLREARAGLRRLRDALIAELMTLVRLDPTVAEPGEHGAGRFELAHLARLRATSEALLARWASQWRADLEDAVLAAAEAGETAILARLVPAARRATAREALSLSDERLLRRLGVPIDAVAPATARMVLKVFTFDLVDTLVAETATRLGRTLRAGILADASPFAMIRDITRVLLGTVEGTRGGRSAADRAETIVRTELGRAWNTSAAARMTATGTAVPDLRKRWVGILDDRTRPAHRQVIRATADTPIPYDEDFVVGGERLRYPLDPRGSPGNTIQCRCAVDVVIPTIREGRAYA